MSCLTATYPLLRDLAAGYNARTSAGCSERGPQLEVVYNQLVTGQSFALAAPALMPAVGPRL